MSNIIDYNPIKWTNTRDAVAAASRPQRCLRGASRQRSPGKGEIFLRNKFHPNPARATTSQTPQRELRLFSFKQQNHPDLPRNKLREMTQTKKNQWGS